MSQTAVPLAVRRVEEALPERHENAHSPTAVTAMASGTAIATSRLEKPSTPPVPQCVATGSGNVSFHDRATAAAVPRTASGRPSASTVVDRRRRERAVAGDRVMRVPP